MMRRSLGVAVGTVCLVLVGCTDPDGTGDTVTGDISTDCVGDGCTGGGIVDRCTNGVDDDGDGTTDCGDEDCLQGDVALCEDGFEESCDDGFDNDGDGISDCNDSNCNNVGTCGPWGEKICNDGIDNEGDGITDCDDPDCANCGGQCCGVGFTCENDACVAQCDAGVERCGANLDVCCEAGQACLSDGCVTLSGNCETDGDCLLGAEVCEPVLGRCIPAGSAEICEYKPPVGVLVPTVGCRWTPPDSGNGNATPGRDNVCMNPVVANLTDDNGDNATNTLDTPDIAFVAWDRADGNCCDEPATLYIVDGKCNEDQTMNTHASISDIDLDESGGLAVGDLDGDGVAEIVAMKLIQGAIAFKRTSPDWSTWEIMWENDTYPTRDVHTRGGAQPALADLNADGFPEVIVGNVVLKGTDGTLEWDGVVTSNGEGGIGNNAFLGPVSIVADIDLDNQPEVIAGHTVYSWDGQVEWTYSDPSNGGYCQGQLPCDGFAAVGNFDDDDEGEVVLVRQGEFVILEHTGDVKHVIPIAWDDCTKDGGQVANESGPPTVADFDGDGRPEIGTAGADYYVVADLDCVGDPLPDGCHDEYILWVKPNEDCSSRATASSVFDFEGDGRAEVIYADETTFRILDGLTGVTLFEDDSHGSNTRLEMPVIADVDNDGNAEVIIPENENNEGTPGVEVWKDASNNWVRSRRIWNQHSYHISNISEDGIVPTYETPNWLGDNPQNNFRQNVQPEGTFWAPDLQVSTIDVNCGTPMVVSACIANDGALAVPDGVKITAWISVGGGERELIETIETTVGIDAKGDCIPVQFSFVPPDQVIFGDTFTIEVEADTDDSGNDTYNECKEENNSLTLDSVCAS